MNQTKCTPRPTDENVCQLSISVVIPVRNEEAFIGHTVQSLLDQQYDLDRFEILVVDGRSTDRTREVVDEYCRQHVNVRLLDNPKMLSSAARNIGITQSKNDVVVVVDGHCDIPSERFLLNLSSAFHESGADIVGRPQTLFVDGASPLQRAIAVARSSRLGHHPDSFIYSGNSKFVPASSVGSAYRREVFSRIGHFDESFDACEDVELNTRADQAGERCYFTENVGIRYFPRATLAGLFRQMSRYGQGRVRLARKHPKTISLKSFIPGIFVLGLLVGPILAAVHSTLAITFLTAVALYALVVGATSIQLAFQRGSFDAFVRLPFVFAIIHVGSGWGILKECLFGINRPA
jgi:succinoglycan biosynthesis protein ExoA